MRLITGIIIFLLFGVSHAEIYKIVDPSGKVQFTDKNPSEKNNSFKVHPVIEVSKDSNGVSFFYTPDFCSGCYKIFAYFKANNIKYSEYNLEQVPAMRSKFIVLGGGMYEHLITCGKNKLISYDFQQKDFEELCLDFAVNKPDTRFTRIIHATGRQNIVE